MSDNANQAPPPHLPDTQPEDCIVYNCLVFDPNINSTRFAHNVLMKTTEGDNHQAYWLVQRMMKTQIGEVKLAVVLRRNTLPDTMEGAEWVITEFRRAIKEIPIDRIVEGSDDPVAEMNAMGFMSRTLIPDPRHQLDNDAIQAMMSRTNLLLAMDVPLYNATRCLYIVMPCCTDGDLFDKMDEQDGFTEPEARYWFSQILDGIEALQYLGLCHQDISLENILVDGNQCYVIDYGMTCCIPYTNIPNDFSEHIRPEHRGERILITPSGQRGKLAYMSPEMLANTHPIDGHAVDLYTVAVILFKMLTGKEWERPCITDRVFRIIAYRRNLAPLLNRWNIPLSDECVDLLQRMLVAWPEERLSLAQIRAHVWMQGPVEGPAAVD